jgi:peptide/nickel transport system substrate-binding protein
LAYNWTLETTVASGDIQDGQKWTFYLFENVTWHDGTPLTSADVAYTLDTIARYDPHRGEQVKPIYRIESPNDHIVEIYSNQTGYFEIFTALDYYILPKHVWEPQFNFTSWVPATPTDLIGSGPYQWGSHEPGQFTSLDRYANWHFSIILKCQLE